MADRPITRDLQRVHDSMRRLSSMQIQAVRAPSSLDLPRRLFHPVTGVATLTSLFQDVGRLLEDHRELTIAYVHLPNSEIVEDRFGWEAHEAFVSMSANFLKGMTTQLVQARRGAVLMHAFADDWVLVLPHDASDDRLEAMIADAFGRHLGAMDPELASLSKVYVGVEYVRSFSRIHHERLIFRGIQDAAARAMDVGQRELMAQARVLDRCLEQNAFAMHYQPIVDTSGGRIYAFEALVRCQAPALASPLVLFDIAERAGQVRTLNRHLRQLAVATATGLLPEEQLFINLHVDDFDDPTVLDPPPLMRELSSRIVLEVTERAAIRDFDRFRGSLEILRGLGFRIALDDLGSGYSALATLAEIAPDFIKLDMGLIRGIDTNPIRQNLVRNIRAFADDLGVRVVAEGVETRAEYEVVREIGCHLVQGYYFARPAPPFVRTLSAEA